MAYYDESGGDAPPFSGGRKTFEGGIAGPRRPSTLLCFVFAVFAVWISPPIVSSVGEEANASLQDWSQIIAPRSCNGCAHDGRNTEEAIGWR